MVFVAVLSVGYPWAGAFTTYCLTIFAARKPSHSGNTAIPLNNNIEEGTSSKVMPSNSPAVNGSQNHDNVNVNNPALTAKEPMVPKSMVHEPLPVEKKRNASTDGTTNRTSNNVTQRQQFLYSKFHSFANRGTV